LIQDQLGVFSSVRSFSRLPLRDARFESHKLPWMPVPGYPGLRGLPPGGAL
jgi:hypothetical protein